MPKLFNLDTDVKINNESINDKLWELSVERDMEGKMGKSIVDRATIDLRGEENIQIPTRELTIDINNDNVFNGLIENSSDDLINYSGSVTANDKILLLQEEDAPDKFYYNTKPEDVIEEFLIIVGIDNYDLDSTKYTINYNFDGMKMWQAIQMINEATQAYTYIKNDIFLYETRLSLDYTGEPSPKETLDYTNKETENLWEIEEELGTTEMFNEVTVKSNPYQKEKKQIIWTGAEESSEITENYEGSDIVGDELQLTEIDEDGNSQPTKNVPIVKTSISVLDLTDEEQLEYLEGSGIDENATNYSEGIIVFEDTEEYPIPPDDHVLSVSYEYHFNQLGAGKNKEFIIELDDPAVNIENLIIYAEEAETNNDLEVSFIDSTADIYVEQSVRENQQEVDVLIQNNSGVDARLYGRQHGEDYPNFMLKGEPYQRNKNLKVVEPNQDSIEAFNKKSSYDIDNDLIQSKMHMKEMAQYFIWKYSEPKSRLNVRTTPDIKLNPGDAVEVTNKGDFLVKGVQYNVSSDNEYSIGYKLTEAYPNWSYEEDGTPVRDGSRDRGDRRTGEPPPIIPEEDIITLEERGNQLPDGSWIPSIYLEWIRPTSNYNRAIVYHQYQDEATFTRVGATEQGHFNINVLKKGTHYVKVVSESHEGITNLLEDVPTLEINIDGKNETNNNVYFDKAYWYSNRIELDWTIDDEDNDFKNLELRLDNNFGEKDNNLLLEGNISGKSSYTFSTPEEEQYTFYIATKDNSGNYNEQPHEVTVQHPGISVELDGSVEGLISSLKIYLPTVMTEYSGEQVFPLDEDTEERSFKGYRVYVTEVNKNGDPVEEIGGASVTWGDVEGNSDQLEEVSEIQDYSVEELNKMIVYFNAETDRDYKVTVGVWDSVYHPDYNKSLFDETLTYIGNASTMQVEPLDIDDKLLGKNEFTQEIGNYEEGMPEQVTLKAGFKNENIEVAGGIGIQYNSDVEDVEIQVVANRFRMFAWDEEDEEWRSEVGFGYGEINGKDTLFLNADNIAIRAGDYDFEEEEGNYIDITDDGIEIYTPDFELSNGNAVFSGEISATRFTLTADNDDYWNDNGEFQFGGSSGIIFENNELTVGSDTHFKEEFSAINKEIQLIQDDTGGAIQIRNDFNEIITHVGNQRAMEGISSEDTGVIVLSDEAGIAKSSVSVQSDEGEGFIVLGNAQITEEPLSFSDGLYLHGGTEDAGDGIILRNSNLDNAINIRADRFGENSIRINNDAGNIIKASLSYDYDTDTGTVFGEVIEGHTKDFKIPHPNPELTDNYYLKHRAIESPTSGENLYRYKKYIEDSIKINLPDYFKHLNKDTQVFVTPQGHFGNGYGEIEDNKLQVEVEQEGEYNILVFGTRKDESAINTWDGAITKKEE